MLGKSFSLPSCQYQSDIENTIQNIRNYDSKCTNELEQNLEENTNRMFHERANWSNKELSDSLFSLMKQMRPDFVAHALVYNDIEGEDNHAQVCQ